MKLIGSKTEKEFRDILISSHKALFKDKLDPRLLAALKTNFPNMKTAYFLNHTPEQGEDIYLMLVDTCNIVNIELDRFNSSSEPLVKTISMEQYKKGLSKMGQIKLTVAIDLTQKDLV
ncbi:hypothetical protein [Desulfosporosinus sp. BICA1-9]|uniref:hypothetical protein n=1 Tax=Desulfosporosinus sp. BICA1-9 TaxID=1531958 RepID=UPI00054C327E|nr:hypothetical protein [Desulfosporosinus sp. BICA1-9]KJS46462.1 MAG: hypothetical protein VR66_25315 [Peptococcaceae bacterium BRH_c23]KJS79185.1 MAG: hypothetical protein JL57_30200 [Desulfosporosinus sp. BICA1-9]HBW37873.1 hypothetical protein [Desulfosporosinus sp.]